MKKVLLAAGALLLATTAVPASAHDWRYDNGYGYGYGNSYNGGTYDYYNRARQHLRECRAHRYVHQDLHDLHDQAHDNGFDDGQDHGDTHDALNAAHEQWHRDHERQAREQPDPAAALAQDALARYLPSVIA